VTCHQPADNMSVSAASVAERFEKTSGEDPIFRLNDGANSPLADVSTREQRRQAYSMLRTKGVIRIGLPVPENAEFVLAAVADPYGYAGNNANRNELSLFRRPLPTTNIAFLSTVMWDGRETLQKGSVEAIDFNLAHQSNSATEGHAQALAPLDQATRELIVAYQRGLFTAQVSDAGAGDLRKDGATGGPEELAKRLFVFGDNDPLGCDPAGMHCVGSNPLFSPIVFTDYQAWAPLDGSGRNRTRGPSRRVRTCSTRCPSRSRALPGSMTISTRRPSWGRARRAMTRPTPVTTPCPRRSISASPTRRSRWPMAETVSAIGSACRG
jgi:hypothetical protein